MKYSVRNKCNLIINVIFSLFLFFSIANNLTYAEELSSIDKLKINKQLSADFAARYSVDVANEEKALLELPRNNGDIILASAGGLLNYKLAAFLGEKIKAKKISISTAYYIQYLSLTKLSKLAQSIGLNHAASCHFSEAMNLKDMSEGKQFTLASCRQSIYTDLQAKEIKLRASEEGVKITALIEKWANSTLLLCLETACVDGHCS